MATEAEVLALFPENYEVGKSTAVQIIDTMLTATVLLRTIEVGSIPETIAHEFALGVGRLIVRQSYPDILTPMRPNEFASPANDLCWLLIELVNCLRNGKPINEKQLLFYANEILSASNIDLAASIKNTLEGEENERA